MNRKFLALFAASLLNCASGAPAQVPSADNTTPASELPPVQDPQTDPPKATPYDPPAYFNQIQGVAPAVGTSATRRKGASRPGNTPSTGLFGQTPARPGRGAPGALPGALDPATDSTAQGVAPQSFTEGVLEEEGNLNLEAAMNSYQSIIAEFDKQRSQAANAVYRLGEVYRKMGRVQEAKVQYARVLREFPDQVQLTRLSHQRLVADGTPQTTTGPEAGATPQFRNRLQQIVSRAASQPPQNAATQPLNPNAAPRIPGDPSITNLPEDSWPELPKPQANNTQQKELLLAEIKLVEDSLREGKKKIEVGAMAPGDLIPTQRELFSLQRELAAFDGNRTQQKELLQSEMKLVEQQRDSVQRQVQNGRASAEDLNKTQRELLTLQRKLAAVDQPQQYGSPISAKTGIPGEIPAEVNQAQRAGSRTTTAVPSRWVASGNTQSAQTMQVQSYPQFASSSQLNAVLPIESLKKQAAEAQRRAGEVRTELSQAESDLRRAVQLLSTVQRSKPESLPASAATDPRYQELKKFYQTFLLNPTPDEYSVTNSLARLTNWVQKIYLPELESQLQAAMLRVEDLKDRMAKLDEEVAVVFARQSAEMGRYQTILTNLRAIYFAKNQWARGQGKQAGDQATENDLAEYLSLRPEYSKTGLLKSVDGETYQINPIGTTPSAKLAKPLGDLPAGHVIDSVTAPPARP